MISLISLDIGLQKITIRTYSSWTRSSVLAAIKVSKEKKRKTAANNLLFKISMPTEIPEYTKKSNA